MSTEKGEPAVKVETPAPEPKVKKVVRIVREAAPASDGAAKKSSGGSAGGAVLGVLGGLLVGGALAVGVALLVKHRKKVTEFLFPSPGEQPATSSQEK